MRNLVFMNRAAPEGPGKAEPPAPGGGEEPAASAQSLVSLRTVAVTLYTANARLSGTIRSIDWRVSDTLNAVDQEYLLLHGATVQPLQSATAEAVQSAQVLVRLGEVVVAIPQEAQVGVERTPARHGLVVERERLPVLIEAWPYTVEGDLHVSPGVDLLQYVHGAHRRFLPMTEAQLVYHPSPLLGGPMPFLLINRHRLQIVLETGGIGHDALLEQDALAAPMAETPVSSVRAAEILAASRVFRDQEIAALDKVCQELLQRGFMDHKLIRSGAAIFQQGEEGETVYVVESGHLEVSQAAAPHLPLHPVGHLGPGDIFGEMAVMGNRKRTATVTASTDCALLAVGDMAIRALLLRFPAATRRLMAMTLERRGALPREVSA